MLGSGWSKTHSSESYITFPRRYHIICVNPHSPYTTNPSLLACVYFKNLCRCATTWGKSGGRGSDQWSPKSMESHLKKYKRAKLSLVFYRLKPSWGVRPWNVFRMTWHDQNFIFLRLCFVPCVRLKLLEQRGSLLSFLLLREWIVLHHCELRVCGAWKSVFFCTMNHILDHYCHF